MGALDVLLFSRVMFWEYLAFSHLLYPLLGVYKSCWLQTVGYPKKQAGWVLEGITSCFPRMRDTSQLSQRCLL